MYFTNRSLFAALAPQSRASRGKHALDQNMGMILEYCTWIHGQLRGHAAWAVTQSPALGRDLHLFKCSATVLKCLICFSLNICCVRDNGSCALKEETRACCHPLLPHSLIGLMMPHKCRITGILLYRQSSKTQNQSKISMLCLWVSKLSYSHRPKGHKPALASNQKEDSAV